MKRKKNPRKVYEMPPVGLTTTICKYLLKREEIQTVDLPEGAEILTVRMEFGQINLWAHSEIGITKTRGRVIEVYGDNQAMTDASRRYIGTVHVTDGIYACHVYERY